jgi:putative Holliday junction resolvase
MGRFLGVDFGDRWVGIALSDPSGTFCSPLSVLERKADFFDRVRKLVEEHEVHRIVLGLPRNMDGSLGPKALQVQDFGRKLEELTGVPVETWDERLTTAEALRALRDAGVSPRKRVAKTDKVAAQILLQSYLDAHPRVRPDFETPP